MKNKILKAQMHGQFIDMQKTRGGIPARLRYCDVPKNLMKRLGVPYVIGRVGWRTPKSPSDRVFIHYTDIKKAGRYRACLTLIRLYKHDKSTFYEYCGDVLEECRIAVKEYGFTFPKSMKDIVKAIFD